MGRDAFLAALAADAGLWPDFDAICGFGGRLQGTPGCDAAFDFVAGRMGALGPVGEAPTRYHGWSLDRIRVTTPDGAEIPALPLLGSVSTPEGGIELDVLDLGRGTPDDIAAAGEAVRGKAVLLAHEYAFAAGTIHRRVKLGAAAAAGAAAVVMVHPAGPVSGGANLCPVPGFGLGADGARRLRAAGRARFLIQGREAVATARNLILALRGRGPGHVVLSAHLDGHPPGESAIDNGSGVAGVLALARAAKPLLEKAGRGLMVCVFGAEEWSLSGSRAWLAALPPAEIAAMAANVNLDSIVGSPNLTALTSGYPGLAAEVARSGAEVALRDLLSVSSDHANFAARGVPAMRAIAGFEEPESRVSQILTGADTRALTSEDELRAATVKVGAILWHLLALEEKAVARMRENAADAQAAVGALSPLPA
ncbi:Zn-dependent exopeptidase M28 [Roseococcus sp. SYP-B2431]|uniref:M28 family metallopeptidase n=1 Tax=Roseococcus sp. SYP-B2431 TaxID=2496640 RepID=UPI00103AC755|nr:M28 family peptidase [Roseococcus sp. SYP-B2431]TCI00130.1 Zn-dependent exopeptidase M28 [Roseococcus sp. SYP-B2431]